MEGELGQRQLLLVGVDVSEMMGHISKSELLLRTTTDQNYRLKSFTYITSHNIRSHAANISSIVQLLSKEQDEAARETFLEMLIVATHQLNQTIEDVNHILTVNEVSKQEFSPGALSVISSEVVQYLRGLIDSEGARVSLSIPSDATVFAVETYVRSIVFHLITNAIKYRDPARRLEINIAATQKEEKWVLTVQDNGLGVDLKRFGKKMFSMYKTFHGNEDARGFGLFLIRNQVEAMGGKIEVTSDLGKGSIFHVYFGKID
jgi:light-regulated signal transduction histidine kinase (bacteriophytochrome)